MKAGFIIRQQLKILLLLPASGICGWVHGQEHFSEGTIRYKVSLIAPPATTEAKQATASEKKGDYIIYIKNKKTRKELQLENGFRTTIISDFSANKKIILKTINNTPYALESDLDEPDDEDRPGYLHGQFAPGTKTKKIAGMTAREATLTYPDRTQNHFYYVPAYQTDLPYLFSRLPGVTGIPAAFEFKMSNGFTARFQLQSAKAEPLPSSLFRTPEHYRIISKKEYQQLMK